MLLSEGKLELDRPSPPTSPKFATNGKDVVTLEQVLLPHRRLPVCADGAEACGTTARAGCAVSPTGG